MIYSYIKYDKLSYMSPTKLVICYYFFIVWPQVMEDICNFGAMGH